jgi:uncharacterized membrane protein
MIAAKPTRISQSSARVDSIDLLRGAVMIIMALDHIREFFHSGAFAFSAEDLTRTTVAIFFTRWITHFCAPVFMFTAGLGAFFRGRRAAKGELSRFLWTRGLWLIFLEFTVVHTAMFFNFDYHLVILEVIWALGCSMFALAALVYLPTGLLAALSVATIVLHNLAGRVDARQFGAAAWVWNLLHQPGGFMVDGTLIVAGYSFIPWAAVMAAGYCFGPVFLLESARRQRVLVALGIGVTLAFIVVRAVSIYGDPVPWSVQHSPVFTLLSFLNCRKYPPSLDFLLMTLGPALLCMGLLDRVKVPITNPLLVFGRVPLFYFLVHIFAIHALAILFALFRYGRAGFLFGPLPSMGGPMHSFPPDYGYDLWVCYAVWVTLVVALYPLCRWFAQLKQHRRDWWLSYL